MTVKMLKHVDTKKHISVTGCYGLPAHEHFITPQLNLRVNQFFLE